MNSLTVQDVFHHFMPDYMQKHKLSGAQAKVVRCITQCKTGYLGMNISFCEDCGRIHTHYNSCRNRCCPMCQELPTQKWMDARKEDVLEAPYFHVVFTLPKELNSIIYSNQKHLYTALYHAASETLNTLSMDSKHLGAKIGYICILHTWGSAMNYHPHLHCIVLGGGLNSKNQWTDKGKKFFLPIKVLSRMFRGKYMEKLQQLWQDKELNFYGSASLYKNSYIFKELLNTCYSKEWVVYCKETFNGAQSVIKYLGKYTHRIAISNQRILYTDDKNVIFLVKDYANKGSWKEVTITGIEFIRRFLMHVPPSRFVRIRHYGLLGNRAKKVKMIRCRTLLRCKQYLSIMKEMNTAQMLKHLYGIDIQCCKECGGHLQNINPNSAMLPRKRLLS